MIDGEYLYFEGKNIYSKMYVNNSVVWGRESISGCLYFLAISDDCAVSMIHYNNNIPTDLQYATVTADGIYTKWQDWDGSEIDINNGDRLYVRCYALNNTGHSTFKTNGLFECHGSVSSLYTSLGKDEMTVYGAFEGLFEHCGGITTAPELPYTKLSSRIYANMFVDCNYLKYPPKLQAVNQLPNSSYLNMFVRCYALEYAPEIFKTHPMKMSTSSCNSMFYMCRNLKESPILDIFYVTNSAFTSMFKYCTNLQKITIYANTIVEGAIDGWVAGVAPNGEFHNYGKYEYTRSISGIPEGWTEIKGE